MNFLSLGFGIFFACYTMSWAREALKIGSSKGLTIPMVAVNAIMAGWEIDLYIRHLMK